MQPAQDMKFGPVNDQCPVPPNATLRAVYKAFLTAPSSDIFDAFADANQFCQLVPNLKQIRTTETDKGQVRRCDFGNDMIIEQQIICVDPPTLFAYVVTMPNPFGIREHFSVIRCLPKDGGTELRWMHYFEHDDPDAMLAMLESTFEHVLAGLTKAYEGYRLPS